VSYRMGAYAATGGRHEASQDYRARRAPSGSAVCERMTLVAALEVGYLESAVPRHRCRCGMGAIIRTLLGLMSQGGLGRYGLRLVNVSARLTWLVQRIGRMYWQEVPYRIGTVVRSLLQYRGWHSAAKVPHQLADHAFGAAWCVLPERAARSSVLRANAEQALAGPPPVFRCRVPARGGVPYWNADPVTGRRIPLKFGLFLDFRHIEGMDIKHLWEVNRQLWMLPLAQGWAAWRDPRYLHRFGRLLEDWLTEIGRAHV
jgi:hypothetical protein